MPAKLDFFSVVQEYMEELAEWSVARARTHAHARTHTHARKRRRVRPGGLSLGLSLVLAAASAASALSSSRVCRPAACACVSSLVKQSADEMVKEAVVDAFSAKRVQFRVVPDIKKLGGALVRDSYNGIHIDNGVIEVVTDAVNGFSNVSAVRKFDLISMF